MLLSNNGVSKVWRDGDWVYKRQPKFLTDNEIWCLKSMYDSGYVPYAEQLEIELIRTKHIRKQEIEIPELFEVNVRLALHELARHRIRHGDLTEYSVIPNNNTLYIIDFAESRLWADPRVDKRPEGDLFWITKTAEKILADSGFADYKITFK